MLQTLKEKNIAEVCVTSDWLSHIALILKKKSTINPVKQLYIQFGQITVLTVCNFIIRINAQHRI